MLTINIVTKTDRLSRLSGFPGGSVLQNPPANAGDVGSIPGLGRCSGKGSGNPLQCFCLGKQSMGLQKFGHDLATK